MGTKVTTTTKAYAKPRGRVAKAGGTKVEGGAAMRIVIYPRPKTKALLVAAAKADHRSVSSYVLHRALLQLAGEASADLDGLIPKDEYEALVFRKYKYRYQKGQGR
jgi:hypothetical protein